jgi:hypothetical protein
MTTFDAPSGEVCTIRRIRTNTPLQAFVTLNDPVFVEAAQGLARRMLRECSVGNRERLNHGWRLCVARSATSAELDRLQSLYQSAYNTYAQSPEAARLIAEDSLGAPGFEVDRAQRAAMTVVANVLLNLDEVLAKK